MEATLISTLTEKLQLATENIKATCNKWGININISKCKVITSPDKHIIQEK